MIIIPFESVGDLYFTDTKETIRNKLGVEYESGFNEIGDVKEYYDYYRKIGLFITYDEFGKIGAFEFFESNLIFKEVELLIQSYRNLLKMFLDLDADLEVDYNSFTSNKYGIGISTNDDPENETATPEAVIVFKRDYYEY